MDFEMDNEEVGYMLNMSNGNGLSQSEIDVILAGCDKKIIDEVNDFFRQHKGFKKFAEGKIGYPFHLLKEMFLNQKAKPHLDADDDFENLTKGIENANKDFKKFAKEKNGLYPFHLLKEEFVKEKDKKTDSQEKIIEICDAMKDLLLFKNSRYGDSALNPKKVFYKGDSTNSILIRLNDKIGRIENRDTELPRVNDAADLIGYLVLLLISMGVTKEDIAKFKD